MADTIAPEILRERNHRWRSAFLKEDFGGAERMLDEDFGGVIEDKKTFLKASAAASWIGAAMGQQLNPAAPDWQGRKEGVARGYFKLQNPAGISDDQIFNLIAEDFRTRDVMHQMATQAAYTGQPLMKVAGQFRERAKGSPVASRWFKYQVDLQKTYLHAQGRVAPYRDIVDSQAAIMKNALGGGKEGFKFNEVADELLKVPEADRPLVISAIGAKMASIPEEQAAFLFDAARQLDRGIEGIVGAVKSNISDFVMLAGASEFAQAGDYEGAEEMRAARLEDRKYHILVNQIRQAAEGIGSPIEREGFWAGSALEVAHMAPMTATAVLPYVGPASLVAYFRDEATTTVLAQNPGMDFQKADLIGTVAAPFMAAMEVVSDRLMLGQMPAFEKLLRSPLLRWASVPGRIGLRTTVGTWMETVEEMGQHLTPPIVQALNSDVPGVDWTARMQELWKIPEQVIGPAFLMSLVGGGGASLSDIRGGRVMVRDLDLLISAGASPELAAEIKAAADRRDFATAEDLMARMVRPGKADAASMEQRRQAAQRLIAKEAPQAEARAAEMRAAQVSMRKTPQGWAVTSPEGEIEMPTHLEAMSVVDRSMAAQRMERDERTMEVFRELSGKAQPGQKFEISDRVLTLTDKLQEAEQRGDQGAVEKIWQRVERERGRTGNPELGPGELQVLGESFVEFAEGVKTYVSRIYAGGRANDLVEEKAHSDLNRWTATGRLTMAQMADMLRQAERATGDTFLTGTTDMDIQEGYADIVRLWATGTRGGKVGAAVQDQERRIRREAVRQRLQEAEKAGVAPKLFQALKDTADFFRAVLLQIARLLKARRAGKLGDLEQFLNESVGLTNETAYDGMLGEDINSGAHTNASTFALRKGADLNSQKKQIPKSTEKMPKLPAPGTFDEVRARVIEWMKENPVARTPDGKTILIANPEKGSLEARAEHWMGSFAKDDPWQREARQVRVDKVESIGAIPLTLTGAQVEARAPSGKTVYLRRYADDKLHAVFVDQENRVTEHGLIQGSVATQYTLDPRKGIEGAVVVQDWTTVAPAYSVSPAKGAESDRASTPGRPPTDQQGGTSAPSAQGYLTADGDIVNETPADDARHQSPGSSPGNSGKNRRESYSLRPDRIRLLDSTTKDEKLHHEFRDPAKILEALLGGGKGSLARESSRADEKKRRKHGGQIASGADLAALAEKAGLVVDPESLRFDPEETGGGGEHVTAPDRVTKRMVKVTKPGLYGFHAEDAGAYLQRWALANKHLGDDVAFEGIVWVPGEGGPRIVISQPFVEGRDSDSTEIEDLLNAKGYHEHDGMWIHPIRGVTIRDTITAGNAITRESDGTVIPVDLILEPTEPVLLRWMREKTGQGRETSFSLKPTAPGNTSTTETGAPTRRIDSQIPIPYMYDDEQERESPESRRDAQAALRELTERAEHDAGGNAHADAAERIRAEAQSLVSWARGKRWLIEPGKFSGFLGNLKQIEGGSEHDVFGEPASGRVLKLTMPPNFGARGALVDYLHNIAWANELFGDDIRFEGVIMTARGPSVVISQPFIKGTKPTEEQVTQWMEMQGYVSMRAGSNMWKHSKTGAVVADTHTGNFVLTKENVLVPIDLQVLNPGSQEMSGGGE